MRQNCIKNMLIYFVWVIFLGLTWASAATAQVAWTGLPGNATDITVGMNGSVWVVGSAPEPGGFGIYKWTGNTWAKVPGGLIHVAVDAKGSLWGTNSLGTIYFSANGAGTDWRALPGNAKDITVAANGSVWVLGSAPEAGGYGIYKWNGSNWSKVPGTLVRVAVDAKGSLWGVNSNGTIFYSANGAGSDWRALPGAATDIGVGADGSVWVIGTGPEAGGFGIFKWNGSNWGKVPGAARSIAVDARGRPLVVNSAGTIYAGNGAQNEVVPPAHVADNRVSVGTPQTEAIGSVDPVVAIGNKVPSAKPFIDQYRGVFLVDEAEGRSSDDRTQLFKVKGKLDWARGVGALNQPSANRLNNPFKDMAAGFANPAMARNQYASFGDPSAAMRVMVKNVAALAQKLGAPNPVPLEITLFDKNNELDFEVAYQVADGWRVTGEIVPAARTQAALRALTLKLHAKMNKITQARSFSVEAEGRLFAKPTFRDPWIGVTPVVEIDNEGSITFGGDFTGACASDPNPDTKPEDCKDQWDVMRLGQIRSTGGVLKLTVQGGAVTGVEAAIKDGRLGPNNVLVDGAILADADMTPGAGLVLKTRGTPGLKDTLSFYRALGGQVEPFKSLFAGIDKLPNPNIPVSQDSEIVITPTGLTVGHINIADPTIRVKINAAAPGVNVRINSDLKGDVDKILRGDASGLPNGYMQVDTNFDSINKAVKDSAGSVPGIGVVVSKAMEAFTFNGVSARIEVQNFNRSSNASANFTLVGQKKSVAVPLDAVFDPNRLPSLVLNAISELVTAMPQWLKDGIGKLPGGQQIVDGLQFVGGQVKGFAEKAVDKVKNEPQKFYCLWLC